MGVTLSLKINNDPFMGGVFTALSLKINNDPFMGVNDPLGVTFKDKQ